ncbi:enterobactin/ferric enterobactin esterase [Microbulbifer aggregans]|uniref:Enterobactin/ferric enterobactin esterase n=1 Tax=Microbulbifer aggregans TaxID=1769779 RepID=A0A1C9W4F9_9GAMM|nr:alpha/beta hydrolase-fold protein [Microbulbifer aggregans]AOS96032.1 enterobactin/ferric enterobactin esterase [Microbulbifer aggregans]
MQKFILLGILLIQLQVAMAMEVSAGKLQTLPEFEFDGIAPRPVHVWLPEGYPGQAPYAVLYMHDGQMLFDASTSWNKQEWGVDEVASKLQASGQTIPFIVVAIENVSETRHGDYFPQKARTLLPEAERRKEHPFNRAELRADKYLQFLVEQLKPYVDANFAVSPDPAHTFIAGSSMGGLISLYALLEYPQIFSAAAAISTHWPGIKPGDDLPVAAAIRAYVEKKLPEPGSHRIYFDHGTETLDAHYPPLQKKVDTIMHNAGYNSPAWQTRVFDGHAHDENSWQARLAEPLLFLLGKNQDSLGEK